MYRDDLPPDMPKSMRKLPVARGYPVPWFVAWLDKNDKPLPRGKGTPDFRILAPNAIPQAVRDNLCWVCGRRILGNTHAFVIGPMCAVNRASAEPPSHTACADWSARACPFLARPHMHRREAGKPEGTVSPAGIMLERNPGVAMVWIGHAQVTADRFPDGGLLFRIGDPDEVRFYAHGRPAERAEIMESIETGMPHLLELAEAEGDEAVAELNAQRDRALTLLPG